MKRKNLVNVDVYNGMHDQLLHGNRNIDCRRRIQDALIIITIKMRYRMNS